MFAVIWQAKFVFVWIPGILYNPILETVFTDWIILLSINLNNFVQTLAKKVPDIKSTVPPTEFIFLLYIANDYESIVYYSQSCKHI